MPWEREAEMYAELKESGSIWIGAGLRASYLQILRLAEAEGVRIEEEDGDGMGVILHVVRGKPC